MLKGSSKKKRSRQEMEEVKHEEDELNEDKHSFLRQYKKLKTEHEMLKVENEGHPPPKQAARGWRYRC